MSVCQNVPRFLPEHDRKLGIPNERKQKETHSIHKKQKYFRWYPRRKHFLRRTFSTQSSRQGTQPDNPPQQYEQVDLCLRTCCIWKTTRHNTSGSWTWLIVASLKSVPLESGTVHLEELQRLLGNVLGHFRSPRALRSPPERRFSPKTFPKPPLRKVAEGY